ncbi:MAG TPA: DUF3301 domain-containing protein [Burkholderiales bacterium]|nr:DUF3301 domain-containing protein [Burkholderiales bacterium]
MTEAATLLVLLALVAWYWYDSMRARELALQLGRAACARDSLQLLDDTVQCVRLRFARGEDGRLKLKRTYRFEFSDTGTNRRDGSIVLHGTAVESLYMEPFLVQ